MYKFWVDVNTAATYNVANPQGQCLSQGVRVSLGIRVNYHCTVGEDEDVWSEGVFTKGSIRHPCKFTLQWALQSVVCVSVEHQTGYSVPFGYVCGIGSI